MGLGKWMRLGKGEDVTGGREKASILADMMEAVIGAVYIERGLEGATRLVLALFEPLMEAAGADGAALDWKTALQELTAARGLGVPEYGITESGPDHAKAFVATALIGGAPFGTGDGSSKKAAEQQSAEQAWTTLLAEVPSD